MLQIVMFLCVSVVVLTCAACQDRRAAKTRRHRELKPLNHQEECVYFTTGGGFTVKATATAEALRDLKMTGLV